MGQGTTCAGELLPASHFSVSVAVKAVVAASTARVTPSEDQPEYFMPLTSSSKSSIRENLKLFPAR
ncbi:hypothetical protein D3C87_1695770 [compost metagenome]